jgi:hypothetical protein
MGNADSKAIDEHESTVVTNSVVTKQSQQITEYSTGAAAAAAGDAEGASSRRTPEKRESEKNNLRRNGSGGSGREDNGSESAPPPMKVSDDQVNVNMPMADLMAYLQVVANNSGNLPLTRRDDPELDRTVSSLSPQDYAKKSAAFVPADVRVISGHFTRYGRVWDLPTSEVRFRPARSARRSQIDRRTPPLPLTSPLFFDTQEYNASDGAHEPGRSYGGACCNTLLKVVYDAANEMDGAAQKAAASEALFEDDEEEEEESAYMGKSSKSGYSLEHVGAQACLISWAHMLRQMKSEFKEVGYPQVPKITTSRKIDLSKPFSLTPEGFNPRKGKKRSLLIGCNYRNDEGAELKASHDDIRSMKVRSICVLLYFSCILQLVAQCVVSFSLPQDYIVNVHGFSEDSDVMTVLLDDEIHTPPTFMNIVEAFKKLSEESQPGDAVFVQFSGHGGRVLDSAVDSEAESYDEVIVPSDYHHTGLIRDTLIFKTLLAPMRYGVTLTILIDCCDNGMVMELPYAWNSKSDKRGSNPKVCPGALFALLCSLHISLTHFLNHNRCP